MTWPRVHGVQCDRHIGSRGYRIVSEKMTGKWKARVLEASKNRVIESQSSGFNGKGQHMALAPKGWAYL